MLVAALPLLMWAKVAGLLCLSLAACWQILDYRGQSSEKLILLDASEDRWRLVTGLEAFEQGQELQLAATQFVTRHLVIAYFKLPQGRQMVRVLPRDSLSSRQHRLLRMLLIHWASNNESK